jgi:hypothetical protein
MLVLITVGTALAVLAAAARIAMAKRAHTANARRPYSLSCFDLRSADDFNSWRLSPCPRA